MPLPKRLEPVTVAQRGQAMSLGGRAPGAPAMTGMLRGKRDALRTTLSLLTFVSISRIHQQFGFLGVFRPALTLSIFALLYALLKPKLLSGDRWIKTWPAMVIVAFSILACLSAVFGISMGRAGKFILEEYSKTLIFCFLLMATIRNARDLSVYVWAYVISVLVVIWMSLFVFGMEKPTSDGFTRLAGGYKYDANEIGVIMLVGLGLTLLTFATSKTKGKLLSVVILIGIGMTIAKTGSRGAFLGLVAEGLALLFCLHSVPVVKRVIFLGVTAGALSLAAPPGYWTQMSTIFSPKKDYNWDSYSGRRQLAKRGIGYMMMYPVFGIGVNNFPRAEGLLSEHAKNLRASDPGIKWSVAHNSYLEAGAEMGIPGGLLWLILVPGGVVAMYRLSRKLPRAWVRGDPEERYLYQMAMYMPATMAGFALSSFFVSFSYADPIYILSAFMAGLYISVDKKLKGTATPGVPVVAPVRTVPNHRMSQGVLFPQPPVTPYPSPSPEGS